MLGSQPICLTLQAAEHGNQRTLHRRRSFLEVKAQEERKILVSAQGEMDKYKLSWRRKKKKEEGKKGNVTEAP